MTPRLPATLDPFPRSPASPGESLALYVHIPFCQSRCTYCDFNTYAGVSHLIPRYMQALVREIRWVAPAGRHPAHTVFFGGGTPSLVPAAQIGAVLACCAELFSLSPDAEVSLEANPATAGPDDLHLLRAAGVNRLSIGMQSAHTRELRLFERRHAAGDVRVMVDAARAAGFENINLDLIYGIPGQTLSRWQESLRAALSLNPEHLSLYGLGIEDGTPLQQQIAGGRLPLPDPDRAADMVEWAADFLESAGFEHYEISNWSRPGFASRHNTHYWLNRPYLGLGAGAHGYAARTRYANVLHPAAYIERIEQQAAPLDFPVSAAADEVQAIDDQQAMAETMIMGLRLMVEGVSLDAFRAQFGRDLWSVYGQELDRLIAHALVERTPDDHVRLTRRGWLLGNRVFVEFV